MSGKNNKESNIDRVLGSRINWTKINTYSNSMCALHQFRYPSVISLSLVNYIAWGKLDKLATCRPNWPFKYVQSITPSRPWLFSLFKQYENSGTLSLLFEEWASTTIVNDQNVRTASSGFKGQLRSQLANGWLEYFSQKTKFSIRLSPTGREVKAEEKGVNKSQSV